MALILKPHGEPMTLLTQRPATSSSTTETTLKTATGITVAGTAGPGMFTGAALKGYGGLHLTLRLNVSYSK